MGRLEGVRQDGSRIPLEIIACPLRSYDGTGVILKDISEQDKAERELRKAKEVAESANRAKDKLVVKLGDNLKKLKYMENLRDNLVHMVVHDMRSPLQAVLSNLEMLGSEISDDDIPDVNFVKHALREATRLADMMQTVLDVSRFENDTMPLNLEICDLRTIAKGAMNTVKDLAGDREIHTSIPEEPAICRCDPAIVDRVITNFLTNALHHTSDRHTVRLEVCRSNGDVRLQVSDPGPGIPAEYHEKFFQKFGRLKTSENGSSRKSTGLGLAFCNLAIKAHDGQIGVDSEVGQGSTFWFTLKRVSEHTEQVREKAEACA